MSLAKRVWDFSTIQDLLHDGDRVVIAVSGGPDSLCLLDVLHSLAARHGLALSVAHLNHGLRPEAAADASFVMKEAQRRGLDYVSETVDVRAAAAASRQSLETTARALRYAFLARVARQTGASQVAVAHSRDDQAETVLMHLLRGAGLRGLRGMLPRRAIDETIMLIRPLLATTRAEILDYCAENGLWPRLDSSNADTTFARNRVRHELLPMLEGFNPNARSALARTAALAAGDYEIWLAAVQRLWSETVLVEPGNQERVAFDRSRWLGLGVAQQRALLRTAAERLTGDQDEVDFAPLEAATRFSRVARPGRSCALAAGLWLRIETERIVIGPRAQMFDTYDWPGLVAGALPAGWHLKIDTVDASGWPAPQAEVVSRWTVFVDAERLAQPVTLRARMPGDRFQPIDMAGRTVKLSDFFVNRKVPFVQRDAWPLLVCGQEIVWVVGLRLDERYRVTERTRQVTRLSVQREPAE